jgi:hypothetical protein
MKLIIGTCACAAGVLVAGCDVATATDGSDQDYESEVQHRASIEFSCAPNDVVVTEIDHTTYMAEGCGYRATYECNVSTGDNGPSPCTRAPDLEPIDAGCK